MSDYRIASRYAKSLFQQTQAENCTDAVYSDLVTLLEVAKGNKDLRGFLKSPVTAAEQKWQVFEKSFKGAHERTLSFLRLLIDKGREAQMTAICEEFVRKYEDHKGIARAKVTSAIPLSDDAMDKIRRYLKGAIQKEDVQLVNVVDKKAIGGMVIEYEDKLLDLSVARELKEIRKSLIYN